MILERHHDTVYDDDPFHTFYVRGPEGAVSTWFSLQTKPILGYSVCDGASIHAWGPRPGPDWIHEKSCPFSPTKADCWWARGSMLGLTPVIEAYDAGQYEFIFGWLEAYYRTEIAPVSPVQ